MLRTRSLSPHPPKARARGKTMLFPFHFQKIGGIKMETEMAWKQGLTKNGQYYDGIVSSADDRLEVFKRMTVTSWGTRTSSNPGGKDKTTVKF